MEKGNNYLIYSLILVCYDIVFMKNFVDINYELEDDLSDENILIIYKYGEILPN